MGVINLGILIQRIKNNLTKSGYVTNTDWASNSTGGVFKTSNNYGTSVSAGGNLYGVPRTESQYASLDSRYFMCKGTLENIKTGLTASALGNIADASGTATDGTTWTGLTLTKTASGYEISFTTVVPGE